MKIEIKQNVGGEWETVHEAQFVDCGRGEYYVDLSVAALRWPTVDAAIKHKGNVPVRVNGVESKVVSLVKWGIDGVRLMLLMPPNFSVTG